MKFISQNFEKRKAVSVPAPLYEESADLLRRVEDQSVQFQSSWTKWIILDKETYSKIEADYNYAIEDIKAARELIDKAIKENSHHDFKVLENIIADIECTLAPKNLPNTRTGFVTGIFEVLPVITMTILPSLVQAGVLSFNVCMVICSAVIGILTFLIKTTNIIVNARESIQVEDAWFLRQAYSELVYFFGIFSKHYTKEIKGSSEGKFYKAMHAENHTLSFHASAQRKRSYGLYKSKNHPVKGPAFLFHARSAHNKINISYQKNSFESYV